MDPTARTGAAHGGAGADGEPGPRARSDGGLRLRDAGPLGRSALVAVLVATAVVATSLAGRWSPTFRGGSVAAPSVPPVTPEPTPLPPDPMADALQDIDVEPWDLRWLGAALTVLVVVGAIYLLVRLVRALPRRRPEDPPEDGGVEPGLAVGGVAAPDLLALRDAVRDARDHLAARVPPVDAVIAAWVALEEAAGRTGVRRDPAATPTEFTVAVLDRTPVDPTAIRALLALYLRARFGTDPIGAADVLVATTAMRTLERGLTLRAEP